MTRATLCCLLALLAGGCSVTGQRSVPPAEDPDLLWELRGRLAVSDAGERWGGSLFWRQERDAHRLELSGPLGQGAVRLVEDAGGAQLVLSADEVHQGPDTETLLRDHFGWTLPLSGLRHWAVGTPQPGRPYHAVPNPAGQLAELQQEGWQLRYDRYQQVGLSWWPRRIRLERGDFHLRLVVDEWLAGPGGG